MKSSQSRPPPNTPRPRTPPWSGKWIVLGALISVVTALGAEAPTTVGAARLLVDVQQSRPSAVPPREISCAGMRARRYGTRGPVVALVHGVHPRGIDEPRLISFARGLEERGLCVVTPEVASFVALSFDPRATVALERCIAELAMDAPAGSIGAVGVSVGGGVLLRVASRASNLHTIWTIGAHYDLSELGDFWLGPGEEHYGAQVLAHAFASELFAPAEANRAAQAIRAELIGRPSPPLRASTRDVLRALHAPVLPESVGRPLSRVLGRHAGDLSALSPRGHLGRVRARVLVLHGIDDPIVPAREAAAILAELPSGAHRILVTPVLRHAETPASDAWAERWALVRFAAEALRALGASPGL